MGEEEGEGELVSLYPLSCMLVSGWTHDEVRKRRKFDFTAICSTY
jgi:hypothetical protein